MSTELSSYEKQANDFLKSTKTKFTTSYKGHYFYFDGDERTRDVYRVTLSRPNHKRFAFTFGQSIANCGEAPTPYDVLACLQKTDIGSFEDFCCEFGYDTDSRKAYKTYKAVLREWKNIERLYSSEELELLQEIT